jgi:hypothetical protein
MEAANYFETSVNFYETTRRNKPQDIHLHIRRRKNLRFRFIKKVLSFQHFFHIYSCPSEIIGMKEIFICIIITFKHCSLFKLLSW